jgi:VIT1/CCC1 family predicted Fe2+/Mn2+ transporter
MRLLSFAVVEFGRHQGATGSCERATDPQMSDKIPMQQREEIPTMTQAKPKPTILKWIIFGALLGGFAGTVLMFSAHEYREAVWGYTGLALLILGVLIAVTGLFIIARMPFGFPKTMRLSRLLSIKVELTRR